MQREKSLDELRRELAQAEIVAASSEWAWYKQVVANRLEARIQRVSTRVPAGEYEYECGVIEGLRQALNLPDNEIYHLTKLLGGEEDG